MHKLAPYLLAVVALSATSSAFALPGEAAAVVKNCGNPAQQELATSPVTNREEMNYYYNDLTLHFQPEAGGWSFTTAWHDHLPMTRSELERRLPCFRIAMEQVAAAPQPVIDPTIASQSAVAVVDDSTFGIPHLWLIVLLIVALIVALFIPIKRKPATAAASDMSGEAAFFPSPFPTEHRPPSQETENRRGLVATNVPRGT